MAALRPMQMKGAGGDPSPSRRMQVTEIQGESAPALPGIIATWWCAGTWVSRTATQIL